MITKTLRASLDVIIFVLTVFMVLYGLSKGFSVIELSTNIVYFSALLLKIIVDIIIKFKVNQQ